VSAISEIMKSAAPATKDRPLRVLMVVERLYEVGGAQTQVIRLVRALRNHGVEARVVTGRWRRSDPRRAELEGGVEVRSIFTAFEMLHIRGLRKFGIYLYILSLMLHLSLRRSHYDVLHVHSATFSGFAVSLVGGWLGKPTIMKVMASGGWGDFKRMQDGLIPGSSYMVRFLRRIDRVICLNEEVEAECRKTGFRAEQFVRIPNAFPVAEVKRRRYYPERTSVEVLFVGRLDAQKNPFLLLEALSILQRLPGGDQINVRFLGGGPQHSQLKERASKLGLAAKVQFPGHVKDVTKYLRRADIFVLPSLSEGLSNAILEAMAHGLPCVVTEIPGNVDLIRHEETGLLVKPADATDLAHALTRLARDPALRERLGRAGRAMVEEHFNMDTVSRRYAELYRTLDVCKTCAG
jgi:glycosyltransferase involved in cell wall biosynthesis